MFDLRLEVSHDDLYFMVHAHDFDLYLIDHLIMVMLAWNNDSV